MKLAGFGLLPLLAVEQKYENETRNSGLLPKFSELNIGHHRVRMHRKCLWPVVRNASIPAALWVVLLYIKTFRHRAAVERLLLRLVRLPAYHEEQLKSGWNGAFVDVPVHCCKHKTRKKFHMRRELVDQAPGADPGGIAPCDIMSFCRPLFRHNSVANYILPLTLAKPSRDLTTKYYWNPP